MTLKPIASITIGLILLGGLAANAQTAPKIFGAEKQKTRTELTKENQDLQHKVDSLMNELKIAKDKLEKQKRQNASTGVQQPKKADPPQTAEVAPEATDSLLSAWFEQHLLNSMIEEEYNMDSVRFTSNVPDSVLVRRLKQINSFIPLPYNDVVRNYMILYTEKAPKRLARLIGLSQYYFPIFEEAFQKYDIPHELEMLAVIESAFNPTALSRVGARGLWQFMYATGKHYGLEINSFVDERTDVYKSTDAAARYLKDAYSIFGDWSLAISSYNCGLGNVNKAINRAGGKKDYWSIHQYLPSETRNYMPAFVGVIYAFAYYKEYGITPEPCTLPAATDTFGIRKNLNFKQISEVVGVPMETIQVLNSQYTHGIIPGNDKVYTLRLPYNYTNDFIAKEEEMYEYKKEEMVGAQVIQGVARSATPSKGGSSSAGVVRYKVRRGDTLGKIASRNHVTVKQIQKWNNLKSTTIREGQTLIVRK